MPIFKRFVKKLFPFLQPGKYKAELRFWKEEIKKYEQWYRGELKELWDEPAPSEDKKVKGYSEKDSAILTWLKIHQERKYLEDLMLDANAFSGMKILDVGSGPFPSALAFEGAEVYCLDPLLPAYLEAGFPIHYYDRAKFVYGFSETMPLPDNFFDAVIAVNSLDHVDDFFQTAREIGRVLKADGKVRVHVHYHKKTIPEPFELDDEIMKEAFAWCRGFEKIHQSKSKRGHVLTYDNEWYAVWSNFYSPPHV